MVRTVLGTILRDAYLKDYLKRNPMEKVAGVNVPKRELRFLTLEQVKALCEKAGPFYGVFFLVLAFTGLRIGEAAGLRWADLDLERKRLVVRRQVIWLRRKDGRTGKPCWSFQEPKSDAGKRVVEIPSVVARFLAEHRDRLKATPNPHGLVFPSAEGGPLDDHNVRNRHFAPALKAIGVQGIRQHDFRRTYIALHVEAGTHPKQVQTRVGHSKIGLTMDVYAKLAGDLALGAEQEAKLNALAEQAIPESGLTTSDSAKHPVNMSSQNAPKSAAPARKAIPSKPLTSHTSSEYPEKV